MSRKSGHDGIDALADWMARSPTGRRLVSGRYPEVLYGFLLITQLLVAASISTGVGSLLTILTLLLVAMFQRFRVSVLRRIAEINDQTGTSD